MLRQILLLSGILALGTAAHNPLTAPPCRKSLELHTLKVPVSGDSKEYRQELLFFAGKGFISEEVVKKGTATFKREVSFFGNSEMWKIDLESDNWGQVEMPQTRKNTRPKSRWKSAAATFNESSELVMFGGCTTTTASGVLNDLWVFTPTCCPARGEWRRVFAKNPPPPRRSHAVVTNATHVIVFGGKTDIQPKRYPSGILTDVWALPLSSPHGGAEHNRLRWTQGTDAPFSERWGTTGTHLTTPEGRDVMAVFGGRMYNGKPKPYSHTYYNELWLYDLMSDSWTQMKPAGAAPAARDHHAAANLDNDLYVFGGRISEVYTADAVKNDLWSFSLRTGEWKSHSSINGTAPQARYMPGLEAAEWKGRQALIVAGGETLPGSTKRTSVNDVWAFVPEEGWSQLISPQCDGTAEATFATGDLAPLGVGVVVTAILFGLYKFSQRSAKAHAREQGNRYWLMA